MSILIATDLSDASAAALRTASRLAVDLDEELIVLHCVDADEHEASWSHLLETDADLPERLWQTGTDHLQDFVDDHLPPHERPSTYRLRVEVDSVVDGIERTVAEVKPSIDLTVVGATGHGRLQQFLLGSTAESTVRRLSSPVLVIPKDASRKPYKHILAPVDMTPCSKQSLEMAARFARIDDTKLTVLHAYMPPVGESTFVPSEISFEDYEGYERQKRRELEAFVDDADLGDLTPQLTVRPGAPHQAILDFANDEHVDLIAMGTHGRNRVERLFVGSTAVKVLRRIPCPTMTLRDSNS